MSAQEWKEKVSKHSPNEVRLKYLEDSNFPFIYHPGADKLMRELEFLVDSARGSQARGIIVSGHSGVGKSTICTKFCRKYPQKHEKERERFEVLYCFCPQDPTMKGVMTSILEAFGDQYCDKGTANQMEIRITNFIKECGVKLIIIDEIQHMLNQGKGRRVSVIGKGILDFFKNITNRTLANIALVGNENAGWILNTDFQIRRRFRKVLNLPLFDSGSEFQKFLITVEEKLCLRKDSNLGDREITHYIWSVTGGILSETLTLLKESAKQAIKDGTEEITLPLLKENEWKIATLSKDEIRELRIKKAYDGDNYGFSPAIV